MAKRKTKTGLVDALRSAIQNSGLTRYAVAKQAGVGFAVLNRFVAGERDLRLETAAKICDALGLELVKRNS